MKKHLKIGLLFFAGLMPLIFNSCIKEEIDASKLDKEFVINPGVAAPLGYIHYELDEVLNNPEKSWNITVDKDSLLYLEYEAEVFSQRASEFLNFTDIYITEFIRDTTQDLDFRFERFPRYNPIQTDTLYLIFTNSLSPDAPLIDSIRVRSMDIILFSTTQYDNLDGKLIIRSPNIKKKYQRQWDDWSVAVQVNRPAQINTVEDIVIIPVNNSEGVNMVPLIIDFRPNYCAVYIPEDYPILQYYVTISNLEYSAIYGHLGKMSFNTPAQDMLIDFYTNLKEGSFNFAEPQMKFYFENSFGLPIQILTNELYATSEMGIVTQIEGPGLPSEKNIFIIDYPTLDEFGESASDSMGINQDNTNLDSVIQTSPSIITFGMEGRTNPLNNNTYNFITDNSQLNVRSKLILPIYGNTDLLNIEDSVMYNFEDFFKNPPKEIRRMALRLNFVNGFPVDIKSQIYLLDENHNLVDSVFEEKFIIKAGIDINGDGLVEPLKSDPIEVELSREKIDNVAISRYLYFKGRLNTYNSDVPENFKFYSFYFLDAYIGAVGDLELNSTGN